jgi:hypothetical protein
MKIVIMKAVRSVAPFAMSCMSETDHISKTYENTSGTLGRQTKQGPEPRFPNPMFTCCTSGSISLHHGLNPL